MARQLRIEYPGAVYHVTSRGNAGHDIFADDGDRAAFLKALQAVVSRFRWQCHAYCLMGNHYHLLIETPEPNLSRGMRQLNGVYTQAYNRRHEQAGHVMQGRFKAILVEKESYLLQLCRYIVRNPVAAGMTKRAADWPWSSFQATAGLVPAPEWLTVDWLLDQFGKTREAAQAHYQEFVAVAPKDDRPWDELTGRIFLGGADFAQMYSAGGHILFQHNLSSTQPGVTSCFNTIYQEIVSATESVRRQVETALGSNLVSTQFHATGFFLDLPWFSNKIKIMLEQSVLISVRKYLTALKVVPQPGSHLASTHNWRAVPSGGGTPSKQ